MKTLLKLFLVFALPLFLQSQDYFAPLNGPTGITVRSSFKDVNGKLYIRTWGVTNVHQKSKDEGATWSPVLIDDSIQIKRLHIDEALNMYAIDFNHAVHKSEDNGTSWNKIFSHEFGGDWILSISPDQVLYLHDGDELYRSFDSGDEWEFIDSVNIYSQIVWHPDGKMFSHNYYDILSSNDGGYNWESVHEVFAGTISSDLHISNEGYIFYRFNSAFDPIYYQVSWDGGNSFEDLNFPETFFWGHLSTNIDGHIFIGDYHGINMSKDKGNTWQNISSGIADSSDIRHVYIDKDQYIYLSMSGDVLYKSIVPSNEITTFIIEKNNLTNAKIYPNPFSGSFKIELENNFNRPLKFELKNQYGSILKSTKFIGNTYEFYKNELPSGLYFYNIYSENKLIATGKIIAQ